MSANEVVRVAAVADVHCRTSNPGVLGPLLAEASERADVLLLCGDLTDYGLADEARVLARELSGVRVPIVAVLGNHDHEGQPADVVHILADAGVHLLDGETHEVRGVGFAGTKGFGGGFGERALAPWGEAMIKQFVHEAVNEALKLEAALARLTTLQRVVLLHYSPIAATVAGEPPEVFPFLGSSRLEEPINRYPVTAVFHGHAHHGCLEGRTTGGVPVYNVALPLLRALRSGESILRVIEIPVAPAVAA